MIRGGYGRGVTTIRKIVEFSGGDALASTDASEPRPHDRRYAGCQGGLGRGRGSLWSAAFVLMRRVGDTTCHNDGNCIILAMEKCLWGSIFGGKINVVDGFW